MKMFGRQEYACWTAPHAASAAILFWSLRVLSEWLLKHKPCSQAEPLSSKSFMETSKSEKYKWRLLQGNLLKTQNGSSIRQSDSWFRPGCYERACQMNQTHQSSTAIAPNSATHQRILGLWSTRFFFDSVWCDNPKPHPRAFECCWCIQLISAPQMGSWWTGTLPLCYFILFHFSHSAIHSQRKSANFNANTSNNGLERTKASNRCRMSWTSGGRPRSQPEKPTGDLEPKGKDSMLRSSMFKPRSLAKSLTIIIESYANRNAK